MTRHAAAYLRRSSVSGDSPGDASREAQQDATRRLAQAFAPDLPVVEYVDWGISGRKSDRPQYVRLRKAIEAGEVEAVFAYSLSRLGRTARDLDDLFTLCERHEVQVITQADGTLTATSATGKFLRRILSELAELESELAKERINSALQAMRERGDVIGRPVWGFLHVKDEHGRTVRVPDPDAPVADVLAAVREAGTILGAVKLLNDRKVPSPKNGTWHTSALTRVVKAHAPELLERKRKGGRPAGPAPLRGIVKCHCGQTMTPNAARRQLYCYRGNRLGVDKHGRAHVREQDIIGWIWSQAQAHHDRGDAAERRQQAEQRQHELRGQRERLGFALTDGLLTRDQARDRAAEIDRELADLAEDLERLTEDRRPLGPREIDPADVGNYRLSPEAISEVNEWLRSVFRWVQLDRDMRPATIEWRHVASD